jgi:hypothetical protein
MFVIVTNIYPAYFISSAQISREGLCVAMRFFIPTSITSISGNDHQGNLQASKVALKSVISIFVMNDQPPTHSASFHPLQSPAAWIVDSWTWQT